MPRLLEVKESGGEVSVLSNFLNSGWRQKSVPNGLLHQSDRALLYSAWISKDAVFV